VYLSLSTRPHSTTGSTAGRPAISLDVEAGGERFGNDFLMRGSGNKALASNLSGSNKKREGPKLEEAGLKKLDLKSLEE
jgi:hypothetical protein